MGLPIWRDPEDSKAKARTAAKVDPTACLRSSIRRRPSVHGRRNQHARLHREPSGLPPRFERSPPLSVGFNGLRRETTRHAHANANASLPSLESLLEVVGPPAPLPPPPVPELHSYSQWEARSRSDAASRQSTAASTRRHPRLPWEENEREAERRDGSEGATSFPHLSRPPRLLHSPEPIQRQDSARSRDTASARRGTLPTPPHDTSAHDDSDSLFIPESDETNLPSTLRRAHPLSRAWRAESPVDGLGDRIRSPTPGDAWEVIRNTIAPDETLPSAESSFATAAVSQSFNTASTRDTQITIPDSPSESQGEEGDGASEEAAEDHSEDESDSTVDANGTTVHCTAAQWAQALHAADDLYFAEMRTPEGRQLIAFHEHARDNEGTRFARPSEAPRVEIGFRLMEQLGRTLEGQGRLAGMYFRLGSDEHEFAEYLETLRIVQRCRGGGSGWVNLDPESLQYARMVELQREMTRESLGPGIWSSRIPSPAEERSSAEPRSSTIESRSGSPAALQAHMDMLRRESIIMEGRVSAARRERDLEEERLNADRELLATVEQRESRLQTRLAEAVLRSRADLRYERERQNEHLRRTAARADNSPPRRVSNRYGQDIRDAARESSGLVQDFIRRNMAVINAQPTVQSPPPSPPRYEPNIPDGPIPDGPVPDDNTQTSVDGPIAHPVSPPSAPSEREVSDALLSGDIQDLDSMRRVVERLVAHEDVPEEWWMSMGLNISRARPRENRSSGASRRSGTSAASGRVTTGRIARDERETNWDRDRNSSRL